jgi:putative PIG3 family NAD(P)H quinone oxidoreductase
VRAIVIEKPGDENVMHVGDVPSPALGAGELRIRVAAAAVNRADLMQRMGLYPPPPGASPVLGLECAGVVAEVGGGVHGWAVGDRAMALLAGGGYAEEVVVPAVCAMRVPARLTLDEAAALPEVVLTVFLNVFQLGGLPAAGWALVHGGGSGIGTAAIQMVRAAGGHTLVTAGSDEKCRQCLALGADAAVNYRTGDFAAEAKSVTGGKGVAVVLDSIGASYLSKNLASLAIGGRLVLIGLMGGAKAEIGLGELLVRRLSVIGSTLRARPTAEKGALVAAFLERFGPALEDGRLRPIVDRVLPLAQAPDAHRAMKASEHFGKIVLSLA